MSEPEYTIGGPPYDCPNCGENYQRLSQHWAMSSDCSSPPLSDEQMAVLTGLRLAGAETYGASDSVRPKFRAVTSTPSRAIWWHEQLGWLSAGVRAARTDRDGRDDTAQLTTHAHSELSSLGWEVPPSDLGLSSLLARTWLSHSGAVSFGSDSDPPRLSWGHENAAWRERVAGLLRSGGFDARVTDDRVLLTVEATAELQEFAAPPVPGSEHKWANSLLDYRVAVADADAASDERTLRLRTALEIARERTTAELTPAEFDARIDAVESDDVAEWLGGGDWDDALSVANVEREGETDTERVTPEVPDRYDREDCLEALRMAADELGEPLSQPGFVEWVTDSDYPSHTTITRQIGPWLEACSEAGVQAAGEFNATYDDFVDALVEIRTELGRWPTSKEYDDARPENAPSRAWIYQQDEHESWQHAIELAKDRYQPTDTE